MTCDSADLDASVPAMPAILPRDWNQLPDAISRRLGDGYGRQRALIADGHLLLVLHEPPVTGTAERAGRLFWRAADGFWRSDRGRHGVGEVKALIDGYRSAIDGLEDRIGTAESAEDWFTVLREVRPLSRAARHLHAALQQAREGIGDPALISLRDAANEQERAADLVQGDAQGGLDFTVARRAEDHARAQHRLNVLAAVFFPITAIATIMGMNLQHGLEGGPVWWFWCVAALAFIAGFAVKGMVAGRMPHRTGSTGGKVPRG